MAVLHVAHLDGGIVLELSFRVGWCRWVTSVLNGGWSVDRLGSSFRDGLADCCPSMAHEVLVALLCSGLLIW